MDYLTIKL